MEEVEVGVAVGDGRDSEEKELTDMEDKDSDCEDSPDSEELSDDDKRASKSVSPSDMSSYESCITCLSAQWCCRMCARAASWAASNTWSRNSKRGICR